MLRFLGNYRDAALLFLRVALGVTFIVMHGWSKLTAGPGKWAELGSAMSIVGITFWPVVWGFLAMMSETLVMVFFIIGFAFRPACLLAAFTMAIATMFTINSGKHAHALELGIVFLSLAFIGPGKFSVDKN